MPSAPSFDAYFRAMRARKGPQQATAATAHKLVRTVYSMLLRGEPFCEETTAAYEEQPNEHELKQLARCAQKFGYQLALVPATDTLAPVEAP
ncbi:hypothetical protein EYB53_015935 [Candidatus Chloroploca sp. M-50]|uniref:Transposase n=1 Tax=Candidatus Chloroploca mongolica TaxID=2528176 RepID=A0ABS4DCN4_9CHLR|nr:hypothetical protein [Candidatus Chloroploca mongolica]MBP1467205.1 hypothetical protein [Candidatus Chloroploca mongolica]